MKLFKINVLLFGRICFIFLPKCLFLQCITNILIGQDKKRNTNNK